MDQRTVDIKVLITLRILDDDQLTPGVDGYLVEGDVREGHGAIAVDRPQQEAMLVGAEHKVHPLGVGPKEPFSPRSNFRQAAEEEGLFAAPAGEEPAADRGR